jgi:hypothetical protein
MIEPFNPSNPVVWTFRGVLGLSVSLGLGIFLLGLAKPSFVKTITEKFHSRCNMKGKLMAVAEKQH